MITTALIAGAVSDRVRFGPWLVFAGLWAALVYFPVAHWVFAFDSADGSVTGGWIANKLRRRLRRRHRGAHQRGHRRARPRPRRRQADGWPRQARPNNLPLVALGAGILWFGWFGFNGGSALGRGQQRVGVVMLNTFNAPCAGILGLAASWRSSGTGTARRWAGCPVPSPAWSRSPPACGGR